MNKQELIQKIDKIPKFAKRDIYIQKETEYVKDDRFKGITEEDKNSILATVSKGYQLVQFGEVFNPVVNYYSELDGDVYYYDGTSLLVIFPTGDNFKTDDGKKIGVYIANSVNKSLAINIEFCIEYNGYKVVLPNDIGGLREIHVGDVKGIITDYENFLNSIKDTWKVILTKFDRPINEDDIKKLLEELNLGERHEETIKSSLDITKSKLWDLFVVTIATLSDKGYRREENKVRKLKRVSEILYDFALAEAL